LYLTKIELGGNLNETRTDDFYFAALMEKFRLANVGERHIRQA
jgi:hypothetical protein